MHEPWGEGAGRGRQGGGAGLAGPQEVLGDLHETAGGNSGAHWLRLTDAAMCSVIICAYESKPSGV